MLTRKQEELTSLNSHKITEKQTKAIPSVDCMRIVISDIVFNHRTPSACGRHMREVAVNISGTLTVSQGKYTCLIGPHGEGKSTLLSIVGGSILLSEENIGSSGVFFVPAHLRLLEVSARPHFFQGTLLDNLTFGVSSGDEDEGVLRVTSICGELGLKSDVIRHIHLGDVNDWGDMLSSTETHLLNLARAIISNPEMLCLHRPTQYLNDQMSDRVTKVLLRFVRERGLRERMGRQHRRPRTLVVTTSDDQNIKSADAAFWVASNGIKRVAIEEARHRNRALRITTMDLT